MVNFYPHIKAYIRRRTLFLIYWGGLKGTALHFHKQKGLRNPCHDHRIQCFGHIWKIRWQIDIHKHVKNSVWVQEKNATGAKTCKQPLCRNSKLL